MWSGVCMHSGTIYPSFYSTPVRHQAGACTAWFLLASKTTFFAPTLVLSHYTYSRFGGLKALKDRSERAARAPLHFDRRRVTRARAVHCQYANTVYVRVRVCKILLVHVHTCRTTWRHRHGKAFDIFCIRRKCGSVVLLPTTILALETARGLGR